MARGFGVEHLSPEQRRYVQGYEGDGNAGKTGSQEQVPPPGMDFRTPIANGSPAERRAGDAEKMQAEWQEKGDARNKKAPEEKLGSPETASARGGKEGRGGRVSDGKKENAGAEKFDVNMAFQKALLEVQLATSLEAAEEVARQFNAAYPADTSQRFESEKRNLGDFEVMIFNFKDGSKILEVSMADKKESAVKGRYKIVENQVLPGGRRRTVHRRVEEPSIGQRLEKAYDTVAGFLNKRIFGGGKEQNKAPELEAVTIERSADMPQFLNSLTEEQYLSLPLESQRAFAKIYRKANADNTGTTEEIQQLVRGDFAGEQKYFPLMVDMLKREANLMTRKIRPEDIERAMKLK